MHSLSDVGARRRYAFVLFLAAVSVPAAPAIAQPPASGDVALAQAQTPAERRVASAERALAANPTSADLHTALALALARRARETADPVFYARAERSIDEALRLAPDHFEALKMRAWVLLGQHRFAEALTLAQALNARAPDDVLVYGFLTDAHVQLGHYDEAERACQWMLDLRPGNIPALTRAAHLRELFGDLDGAAELMRASYDRTDPSEAEDRAWMLTHLAHLAIVDGRPNDAEPLLQAALALFPDYHYALAQLAKVRLAQDRPREAVALLEKRYEAAPHPEHLFDLAQALTRAGQKRRASVAFARFETAALAESVGWDNANRELITYYVDYARKPADALRLADREVARRQDVETLAAYAWALRASKRHDEARTVMSRVVGVGTRDPEIRRRATAILGDAAAGRETAARAPDAGR